MKGYTEDHKERAQRLVRARTTPQELALWYVYANDQRDEAKKALSDAVALIGEATSDGVWKKFWTQNRKERMEKIKEAMV
jgi:hypothetical protein